jgi:hypothetical protein
MGFFGEILEKLGIGGATAAKGKGTLGSPTSSPGC